MIINPELIKTKALEILPSSFTEEEALDALEHVAIELYGDEPHPLYVGVAADLMEMASVA